LVGSFVTIQYGLLTALEKGEKFLERNQWLSIFWKRRGEKQMFASF